MANETSNAGAVSRWMVALGLASLAVSFAVSGLAFYTPTQAEGPSGKPAAPTATARRAVAVAFVDVLDGVVPMAPLRPGRVVEIPFKEGDAVKKGDVLLRIDDKLAKLEQAEAEAALAVAMEQVNGARMLVKQHKAGEKALRAAVKAAEADLASAEAQEAKARRFNKSDLGPTAEDVKAAAGVVQKARASVTAREAELEKLKDTDPEAAVRVAEKNVELKEALVAKAKEGVELCLVRAPKDGTVLRLSVSVGEVLGMVPNPHKPVPLVFCAKGERIVRAEVEQEFAGKVSLGLEAVIHDDATGGGTNKPEWRGKVIRIGDWYTQRRVMMMEPMQFNDVRTLEVIVSVDPSKYPLRIGQRLRVMLDGVTN